MDQFSRISMFLSVVDNGSFAGAARELGISSSAVSKQVQNLEHELKVKLLNRTTRQVSLTEEGAVYFERAGRALVDLQEAKEQIYELRSNPRGPIKVSLPISLGLKFLTPAIVSFARDYPEVELNVSLDDRHVDIVAEDYDLVLRIGSLPDSSLVARRLASCPLLICASPAYLKQHGTPETPEELSQHNVLAYTRNNASNDWRYQSADGKPGHVSLKGTFKCDAGDILCQSAIAGLGIVILPVFYIATHLVSGELQVILPEYETSPQREIHAVFRPNPYMSTRMRLFVDHLAKACRELPWEKKA
ncbi:MAG: LysR family transcriptional regulator [Rhizobiaceae bacterium]|nr:LysR family transcriptional regulator [Rhizobiaceae bacterium]